MAEATLYWGLGLIALSVLLVFLEALLPSGGLIAVGSICSAVAGVVLLFMTSLTWGVTGVAVVLVLAPVSFFGAMKIFPNTPIGRALIGGEPDEQRVERELAEAEERARRRALVGREGVALGDLRPVGDVEIDGASHSALADVDWIDAGTRVVVVRAGEFELRVRRA